MISKVIEVSKAIHYLEGILKGVSCDRKINDQEIIALDRWLANYKFMSYIDDFAEIQRLISDALEDGQITEFERDAVLDYCLLYQALEGPIDTDTKEMRNLHGIVHGIICDNIASIDELKYLEEWMLYHESLKDTWPFMEIFNIVESIIKDGKVSESEQKKFIEFTLPFIERPASSDFKDETVYNRKYLESNTPTMASLDRFFDPIDSLIIAGNCFCITGVVNGYKRPQLIELIMRQGGKFKNSVTHGVNFLVVGQIANKNWAFSTYGRKIEKVKMSYPEVKVIPQRIFIESLNVVI